jgi:sigma-B regulation protein RsbU (phosphoserine phosphatase)
VFIYRKATGTVEEVLLSGMPLGAMKKYPYGLHETELGPGDAVLLISDGLPEQKNDAGEMFDYARVQGLLAESAGASSPDGVITTLTTAGDAFMNGAVQDDDFTMLVIKRNA